MSTQNTFTMSPEEAADLLSRNRLDDQTSPYLLQHQHNPVHWQPWGDAAFAAARALDRPIFLSIGYSTCYWCHVMERESFESEAIASLLNDNFVSIKLDREERPDIDELYMTATVLLNQGQGGWPMSVWLEPQSLRPFLAATYFPPDDRYGRPGFPSVLEQILGYWREKKDGLIDQAHRVADAVTARYVMAQQPRPVTQSLVRRAVDTLMSMYDGEHGGFGRGGNKFPTPVNLDLLIETAWDEPDVRRAVRHTMDRMAIGGMCDQVGGGFHRYSVDREWLVPHFEKMLYDNGQLASTYAAAYERDQDPFDARIIRNTLSYVMREMTADAGAFFSAQDAEVDGREGLNYLWTPDEVRAALEAAQGFTEEDIAFALDVYGLSNGPNFKDPHHPGEPPRNVLRLDDRPSVLAERRGEPVEAIHERLERINAALLATRDQRKQPRLDDKILTSWNGLMIGGFADGGRALDEPDYIAAADRAARAILNDMRADDGGLLRSARAGEAKINAFLEDYACFIHGLLRLHRATDNKTHLDEAVRLADIAEQKFGDESGGGYYDTEADQTDLFVRVSSTYDGALPSPTGLMVRNLAELHRATGEHRYLERAVAAIRSLSGLLSEQPAGMAVTVATVHRLLQDRPDLAVALARSDVDEPIAAESPVSIELEAKPVRLEPGGVATAMVQLRIADGYHVTASEPGDVTLTPFALSWRGSEDVAVQPAYPQGVPRGEKDMRAMAYAGEVDVPVVIRAADTSAGRATGRLIATYQACTEQACLAPRTVELPIEIVIGEE